jgi:hypothetical protein
MNLKCEPHEQCCGKDVSMVHKLNPLIMKEKHALRPIEKEVIRLHQAGKSPDVIAIRVGMKMSKILAILNMPLSR